MANATTICMATINDSINLTLYVNLNESQRT